MANETTFDISAVFSNLVETAGKIGQQQVDLLTNGFKSLTTAVEPLGKAALELPGNVVNTVTQTFQNVTTAIVPKK
jgi:chlorosome envelope protein B